MKTPRHKKNIRQRMAITHGGPLCSNCGTPGRHFIPPSFGEGGFYACPTHQRLPVTVETTKGAIQGHITGDPDMPPETRAALEEMMRILAQQAMDGVLHLPAVPTTAPNPHETHAEN